MAVTNTGPIKQAIVAALRANGTLHTALSGGVHEGFAPDKTVYPFLAYNLVSAPYVYDWTAYMLIASFDLNVWSKSSVEAETLDTLVLETLDDAQLSVGGQSLLYCRRVADLSSPDRDEEGRKIYAAGGTYEIWTDQPH